MPMSATVFQEVVQSQRALSNTTMRTCLFFCITKNLFVEKKTTNVSFCSQHFRNIQSVFMHFQLRTQSLTSSSKSVGSQHNCNNVRTWHVDRVDPSGDWWWHLRHPHAPSFAFFGSLDLLGAWVFAKKKNTQKWKVLPLVDLFSMWKICIWFF